MEFFLLLILFTALWMMDYRPGRKQRPRRAGVLYVVLFTLSLGGLILALCLDTPPTLTGLLVRFFQEGSA